MTRLTREFFEELYVNQAKTADEIASLTGKSYKYIRGRLSHFGFIEKTRNMSELPKDVLIELYEKQGKSMSEIANILGCSKAKVTEWVNKYELSVRRLDLSNAYEINKEELKELYEINLLSQQDIADKIGRSQNYVKRKMEQYGIVARDSGIAQAMKRGIPFNEHFFDTWNHDMAYVLGLLFADGNIHRYEIKLQLQEADRDTIEQVMDAMEIPKEYIKEIIAKQYGTKHYGFAVNRRDVANKLIALGLVPNKSKVKKFPKVPSEFKPDFIRGYFDGNGSVGVNNKQINLQISCGSHDFINVLQRELSSILHHDVKVHGDKRYSGNFNLHIHSSRLANDFYSFVYNTPSTLFMKRKRDKFTKLLGLYRAPNSKECID